MSGDHFTFTIPGLDIEFDANRLRREHHELHGELTVKCGLPSAQTVNGNLNTSDFNFSSLRSRSERAKLLAIRSQTNGDVDWFLLLEDFCRRVFDAEREGDPDVDLRTMERPQRGDEIRIMGLVLPRRHPAILFGDGGAAKSYTALYIAGVLAMRGLHVGFFDWELCGEDHRDRLERLFGATTMPEIRYVRCERPLVAESERLRRIVRERAIDYAIFDSIAFACDGPPEAAEIASKYFRAVREIGVGSMHNAHISKSTESGDQKPFGSAFWHNGARSTWFVQSVESDPDQLRLGFFNRKANLGPISRPASFAVRFSDDTTFFEGTEMAPELAAKMTIRQQMDTILKRGSMLVQEVSDALDINRDSIYKTVQRNPNHFILLDGGRVGIRA